MAIIFCSQCGKKVTDRMEVCPHCQSVLIKKAVPKPVTKEEVQISLKGNLVSTGIALGLTLLTAFVWSIFATIILGKFIGTEAAAAVGYVRNTFFTRGLLLLLVETAIFCVLPVFCKGKSVLHFCLTAALALLSGLLFRTFLPAILLQGGNVEPYLLAYTMMAAPGFAFAFPVLLGALSLAGFDRPFGKGIALQAGLCAAFFVLNIILCLLMVVLFGMATGGFSMSSRIASIIVLLLAVLCSKGFRQLITPKQPA